MSLRCNNHVCCALHPVFPQITLNFEMIWVGLLTLQGDARNCPTQQREAEGGLLGVPHVWSWTRSQCHALSFRKEYVLIKHLAYGAKTIPFLEKNTTVIPIRSEIWRAFPNSRPLHPARNWFSNDEFCPPFTYRCNFCMYARIYIICIYIYVIICIYRYIL